MYCPECGNDAGDAKFCPECGSNLAGVQDALRGRPAAPQGKAAATAAPAAPAKRGLSPALIWGIFGVVAVIVIVVVVMVSGGFGGSGSSGGATTSASGNASPIAGVTTGSYDVLVKKANAFYDKGMQAFQSNDVNGASSYFKAAAMTYAAAWSKKSTDPNVGTDYATALFYGGLPDAAIKEINVVLKTNPGFQMGWMSLGLFYQHQLALAQQNNETAAAKKAKALAVAAFTRAIAINPKSAAGKQADSSLKQIQQQ
jgi:hypothetical protein